MEKPEDPNPIGQTTFIILLLLFYCLLKHLQVGCLKTRLRVQCQLRPRRSVYFLKTISASLLFSLVFWLKKMPLHPCSRKKKGRRGYYRRQEREKRLGITVLPSKKWLPLQANRLPGLLDCSKQELPQAVCYSSTTECI